MYTTKSSVEKSLADLSAIQLALEEVAKEERERSGESSNTSGDKNESSEETKGSDVGSVEKRVTVVEASCSFDNRSTFEVVEMLLKTIFVVQGQQQLDTSAHDDVRLLGQSLLQSSISDGHRAVQNLLQVHI